MTRSWVVRTDKGKTAYLAGELAAGRLRQGWGMHAEQDLRTIADARRGRRPLTADQQNTWRGNRRLLDTEPDGVQVGDLILLPHLPAHGNWSLVRVAGPYRWEGPGEPNTFGMPDYGHVLPVESVSARPIHPLEEGVSARLRQTMRNQSRMWNIDDLSADVSELAAAVTGEAPPPVPSLVRLPKVLTSVEAAAWEALQKQFHGAEFERPCVLLLESLYGPENVEHTGGSGERGADAIVTHVDPFGIVHRLAVQIKMWTWDADWTRPLDQIRQAQAAYEGITGALILSTSEKATDRFEARRQELEIELRIPVKVVFRQELIRAFVSHLPDLGATD